MPLDHGCLVDAGMRSAGAGCRLQTCRRGDPQRFDSAFPATALASVSTHGLVGYDVASTRRRSSVRIRVAVLFRDQVWTPGPRLLSPRGAMEARRFPEPEVVGSIPTAGDLQMYTHSDSNRGPSPC